MTTHGDSPAARSATPTAITEMDAAAGALDAAGGAPGDMRPGEAGAHLSGALGEDVAMSLAQSEARLEHGSPADAQVSSNHQTGTVADEPGTEPDEDPDDQDPNDQDLDDQDLDGQDPNGQDPNGQEKADGATADQQRVLADASPAGAEATDTPLVSLSSADEPRADSSDPESDVPSRPEASTDPASSAEPVSTSTPVAGDRQPRTSPHPEPWPEPRPETATEHTDPAEHTGPTEPWPEPQSGTATGLWSESQRETEPGPTAGWAEAVWAATEPVKLDPPIEPDPPTEAAAPTEFDPPTAFNAPTEPPRPEPDAISSAVPTAGPEPISLSWTVPETVRAPGELSPELFPDAKPYAGAGPGAYAAEVSYRGGEPYPAGDSSTEFGHINGVTRHPEDDLAHGLRALRDSIAATAYPLRLPTAEEAQRVAAALVTQLDDYLLPRLARLDAPLLVVVGGSTGAGKSTLVNSIVRAPVSAAGVLRPTTRAPVLVCHPDDTAWFRQGDLLPGLTRTTEVSTDPHTLQLVAAPALVPGLAFVDAPDVDSVVDENRALAAQLLAAADLWLFVTTAARYADAVPWELLRTAQLRGTVTALVLDRVPVEAIAEITDHLRQMLAVYGLGSAPLFVLPETPVTGPGLLPEDLISPLRRWFERLAADATARSAVVRQTLDGALAALEPAVAGLAAAADDQSAAAKTLAERVGAAHGAALSAVERGVHDGALLRGEVLARWQEFVGTGELLRALETRIGRVRDRVSAAVTGRPAPGRQLQTAIESNLVTLIRGAAADAAEQSYTSWQAHPAGATLLQPALSRVADDLAGQVEVLVREWQRGVLELVRAEGGERRSVARGAAYAVNASGLAVMIAVFASTAFVPTGLEIAAAGGTTVAAQKILEAIFGDQAIRSLANKARADLLTRVDALLETQATRYLTLLDEKAAEADPGAELRAAAAAVERARHEAALTGGAALNLPDGVS